MGAAASVCLVRPSSRSSFFPQEDETALLVPLGLAFLIGITLGKISSANGESADEGRGGWWFLFSTSFSWSSFEAGVHSVGVPLYVAIVTLYLTAVAFRQDWWPIYRRLVRRWYRSESCSWWTSFYPAASTTTSKALEEAVTPIEESLSAAALPPHDGKDQVLDGIIDDDSQLQPVDLTGVYQLVSNDNFEAFLAAQGVPWALRSAANRVRPIHRIAHKGRSLTIKIEGIIESQTTYLIGGPPVETSVRGRVFVDTVAYLEDDNDDHRDNGSTTHHPNGDGPHLRRRGVVVTKKALTEPYDVTVRRELSDDGNVITLTSRAVFRDGRSPVQSTQVFHRMVGLESTHRPERSQ